MLSIAYPAYLRENLLKVRSSDVMTMTGFYEDRVQMSFDNRMNNY